MRVAFTNGYDPVMAKSKRQRENEYLETLNQHLQLEILRLQRFDPQREEEFRITVPAPPSKKNGRVGHRPSNVSLQAQTMIREAVLTAIARHAPLWPKDDVQMRVEYDASSRLLTARVSQLRPQQAPYDRRRDVPNLFDVICDALEGAVYVNDNQIARLSAERIPPS